MTETELKLKIDKQQEIITDLVAAIKKWIEIQPAWNDKNLEQLNIAFMFSYRAIAKAAKP